MLRSRLIALVGACLVALTWVGLHSLETDPAQRRALRSQASDAEPESASEAVHAASRLGRDAAAGSAAQPARRAPVAKAPRSAQPVAPAVTTEPTQQEIDAARQARLLAQEAMFRRWQKESEDSEWTHAAHESLGDIVERSKLGPEVIQDVSCKRSLCRVQLRFSKLGDAAGFAALADNPDGIEVIDLTPNLNTAVEPEEPATPQPGVRGVEPARQYLVYLARPGQRIADVMQDGS